MINEGSVCSDDSCQESECCAARCVVYDASYALSDNIYSNIDADKTQYGLDTFFLRATVTPKLTGDISPDANYGVLFMKQDDFPDPYPGLQVFLFDSGDVRFRFAGTSELGNDNQVALSGGWVAGNSVGLLFIRRGNILEIYVDGVLSSTHTHANIGTFDVSNTADLLIGTHAADLGGYSLNADVTNVQICLGNAGLCVASNCDANYYFTSIGGLCAGVICTPNECCTAYGICDASDCTANYILKSTPDLCATDTCTQAECCDERPCTDEPIFGSEYIVRGSGLDHMAARAIMCKRGYKVDTGEDTDVVRCNFGTWTSSTLVCELSVCPPFNDLDQSPS